MKEWRVFSISDVTCTERRYNVPEHVYVDDKERIEAWPNVLLTVRSFYVQTLTYLADQNCVFFSYFRPCAVLAAAALWVKVEKLLENVNVYFAEVFLSLGFLFFS